MVNRHLFSPLVWYATILSNQKRKSTLDRK
uniref:Uncharacterized protein n=1 Tax=Klebsiella phage FKP3 TaxID=3231233 RepID=A0AAU8HZ11_9CAUD